MEKFLGQFKESLVHTIEEITQFNKDHKTMTEILQFSKEHKEQELPPGTTSHLFYRSEPNSRRRSSFAQFCPP